jgi:GT2 family glycosyltransferase
MPRMSVVVVSWNARGYVHECLSSLRRQSISDYVEVIVVDNASTDGTPEMVRDVFPEVLLIRKDVNLGFARANNVGMRAARGEFVSLINSDVNVPPECLEKILHFMEDNPKVGVTGPKMLRPDGQQARSYMRFPSVWNCLCTALSLDSLLKGLGPFGGLLMTDFDGTRTHDVDVLNGWFLTVRTEALKAVGLLDERFFMYGEDIDWSYRFHKSGWQRLYLAEAEATHYGGASSSIASTRFYIEKHKANMQYWAKHHSIPGRLAFWVTTLLHQGIRAGAYSVVYLVSKARRFEATLKIKRSLACIAWLMGRRVVA